MNRKQIFAEATDIQLTPVLWATYSNAGDIKSLGDGDYDVLMEVRDILDGHNAINRFGIHLIHADFDTSKDEIFLERTDVKKRIQVTAIHKTTKSDKGNDLIETQWVFNRQKLVCCRRVCALENSEDGARHSWLHFSTEE